MHREDSIITESGNMMINKKNQNKAIELFTRVFMSIDRFKADILVEDEMNLKEYGINAQILHLPGHSKGSIGVLTENNNLICGDLFENRKRPRLYFIDNKKEIEYSLNKLDKYIIEDVYPGHGLKFKFSELEI